MFRSWIITPVLPPIFASFGARSPTRCGVVKMDDLLARRYSYATFKTSIGGDTVGSWSGQNHFSVPTWPDSVSNSRIDQM